MQAAGGLPGERETVERDVDDEIADDRGPLANDPGHLDARGTGFVVLDEAAAQPCLRGVADHRPRHVGGRATVEDTIADRDLRR